MTREVTLVVGPPCSGKSTWIAEHAQPGDLVIDWNWLAIEAGSPVTHDHAKQYAAAATTRRNQLEHDVTAMTSGRAFVVRTLPRLDERAAAAARLDAVIHVIDPGVQTCLARAAFDGRPADIDAAILRWYGLAWGARCYDPAPPAARTTNPRRTREWRTVRAIVLRSQPPCWRGHPMRYGIPYNRQHPDPLYPTVDHIVPVSQGGAWYDLANLRPACWEHNTDHTSEGAQPATLTGERRVSEEW